MRDYLIETFKTDSEGKELIREIIAELYANSFYDVLYALEHTGYRIDPLHCSVRKDVSILDIIDALKEEKKEILVIHIIEYLRRKFPEKALVCIRRILGNYGFSPSSWCLRCGYEIWERKWSKEHFYCTANGETDVREDYYVEEVNLDNDEICFSKNNTVINGLVKI